MRKIAVTQQWCKLAFKEQVLFLKSQSKLFLFKSIISTFKGLMKSVGEQIPPCGIDAFHIGVLDCDGFFVHKREGPLGALWLIICMISFTTLECRLFKHHTLFFAFYFVIQEYHLIFLHILWWQQFSSLNCMLNGGGGWDTEDKALEVSVLPLVLSPSWNNRQKVRVSPPGYEKKRQCISRAFVPLTYMGFSHRYCWFIVPRPSMGHKLLE